MYHFKVDSGALPGALDRFSAMFVAPRFDVRSIAGEVRAVDAEFSGHRSSDVYRLDMVRRAAVGTQHSYLRHFGGNNATLPLGADALRDRLVRFHRTLYSAHRMRLVVIGAGKPPHMCPSSEPLDQLVEMVVPLFHGVPRVRSRRGGEPPLPASATAIRCASVKDTHRLMLRFQLHTLSIVSSMKVSASRCANPSRTATPRTCSARPARARSWPC